jgi:hypothetical protein
MTPSTPQLWYWFAGAIVLQLIASFFKSRFARQFYYLRGTAITRFSIMDLELPGSPASIHSIIAGIDRLPAERPAKIRRALRNNLLLDFIFMIGCYPAIFLLCMHCAAHMRPGGPGQLIFQGLAWLQALAWLADIFENIYLLRQLHRPSISTRWLYNGYRFVVQLKWAVIGVAVICALSDMAYSWLAGQYQPAFMYIGLGLLALVGLALIVMVSRTVRAMFPPEKQAVPDNALR